MKKKALFLRPDHIGDFILTTPAFHSFKKSYPEIEVVLLCGSLNYGFAKENPYIDRIIVSDFPWLSRDKNSQWLNLIKTLFRIKKEKFDVIFNFRIAVKTGLFALMCASYRYGFDVKKSGWVNNVKIHYDLNTHIVDNYLHLIEKYGAKIEHKGLELFLSDSNKNTLSKKFNTSEPYIVVSPGAGYPSKLWYKERWREVIHYLLKETSFNILVTGSEAEYKYNQSIIEKINSNRVRNTAGKIDLQELGYIIKGAKFLVSVDSAAMHIAVAVKTPVIALFGPTNPNHWGPYPNGLPNKVVISNVKCQFCKIYDCKTRECMNNIAVKNVKNSIEELLEDLN